MLSKLGKTLRKVRKGKQVSLSSVADEHLSKSQISRFERGESEISCIRLINILDKLHISLDEFLILRDNDYPKTASLLT
ncbi:DNA-binding helix-turn-helix protein [Streptococcus pseudoporcinus LQ 940-04]|uniref:DNA-binding helix-turn-helix protein n=1 Tax=Streptococcus pseudoporcinus LQ 940-04 TaxID=875093 RepID=G5KBK3_9STRE|nr:DNA-binding helix-turn-helix protein [Streptococcus pseudoporcinus LQ 940-04]